MNSIIKPVTGKCIMLAAVMLLSTNRLCAQINLKKLKEQVTKTPAEGNRDSQNQSNPSSNNQTQNTSNSGSSSGNKSQGPGLTREEETAWMVYYQDATAEARAMVWREGLYDGYFMNMVQLDSRKMNRFLFFISGLDKKIDTDKKRMKEPFMFYGNQSNMPEGMEYGGPNRDFLGSRLGTGVNKNITEYYTWRATVKTKYYAEFAKNVQQYTDKSKSLVAEGKNALGFAFRYANSAMQLSNAIAAFQTANQEITKAKKDAEAQYNAVLTALRPSLSGDFHEGKLEQICLFNQKQIPGKENREQEIQEIIPGKPTYLVAYAVDPLTSLGAKSVMSSGNRPKLPYLQLKNITKDDQSEPVVLPVYCNESIFSKMKDAFYVEFDMFPDLNKTNYESHLNYMPSLHLTQFFLTQPVGTYKYELFLGEINGTIGPKSVFTITITEETKAALQAYHDQMWAKKLASVTFNTEYGAGDDRNQVMNWQDLGRHGKLLKLSVAQTGKVMKPWPNENQVESFVGSGWILVERTDGKHEVIGYSFVKKAGDKLWRVTSVASDMDYYTLMVPSTVGSKIAAKRLELGYEIPAANITKGNIW